LELAMTPLRRRMTEDLILRNRSLKTIRASIGWVGDFARYLPTSPDQLGPEPVRSSLLHERQVSANIYRQARLALRLYSSVTLGREWAIAEIARPRAPRKHPVVLSQGKMARLLDEVVLPPGPFQPLILRRTRDTRGEGTRAPRQAADCFVLQSVSSETAATDPSVFST
jgi:hypothetical protein